MINLNPYIMLISEKQRWMLLGTAIAPPISPNSDRTASFPNSDRTPTSPKVIAFPHPQKRSHSLIPTAIASHHPTTAIALHQP